MSNPTKFVPPEFAHHWDLKNNKPPQHTLADWIERAKNEPGMCEICETEEAWKYGGVGMCFTCTTGESDASGDYELQIGAPWPKTKK